MSDIKIRQSMENLEKALNRLGEALDEANDNALMIDGTIQRFEFTVELFWKTLKRSLAAEGIEANSPKETLKQAYAAKWLNDETIWLQMLKDRNETSHVYDEDKAREIYSHIKAYYKLLQTTYQFLVKKV